MSLHAHETGSGTPGRRRASPSAPAQRLQSQAGNRALTDLLSPRSVQREPDADPFAVLAGEERTGMLGGALSGTDPLAGAGDAIMDAGSQAFSGVERAARSIPGLGSMIPGGDAQGGAGTGMGGMIGNPFGPGLGAGLGTLLGGGAGGVGEGLGGGIGSGAGAILGGGGLIGATVDAGKQAASGAGRAVRAVPGIGDLVADVAGRVAPPPHAKHAGHAHAQHAGATARPGPAVAPHLDKRALAQQRYDMARGVIPPEDVPGAAPAH